MSWSYFIYMIQTKTYTQGTGHKYPSLYIVIGYSQLILKRTNNIQNAVHIFRLYTFCCSFYEHGLTDMKSQTRKYIYIFQYFYISIFGNMCIWDVFMLRPPGKYISGVWGIGTLRTNFTEILKMQLKMSSAKWWQFSVCLNVLNKIQICPYCGLDRPVLESCHTGQHSSCIKYCIPVVVFTIALVDGAHHKKPSWWRPPQKTLQPLPPRVIEETWTKNNTYVMIILYLHDTNKNIYTRHWT